MKPRPPPPTARRDVAVVDPVELDVDLEAGHRARERREDLADEGGLADVGVLVADDARVIGDVGVITNVVMTAELSAWRPRFCMKFSALPSAPRGTSR